MSAISPSQTGTTLPLACAGAALVEHVPKPFAHKKPNLACGAKNAVTRLGDIDRIELAGAEFAKASDREHARLRAFGL